MEYLIQTSFKFAAELLVLAFILITFLQSGIDKLTDWNGNVAYIKSVFAKTFLANISTFLLAIIAFAEMLAGILSLIGIYQILANQDTFYGFLALIVAAKVLLALLFGQRVAKDYAGAMTIVVYFGIVLFGIYLFLI
ncbi:MAG TPA: DoxX family protein [Flavobacteriia bacterium]|nr:DoxX family protein [Flavobacteriia bacterium]